MDLFRNEKPVVYEKVHDKDKKYFIVPLKLCNKSADNNEISYDIDRELLCKIE